MSRTFALISGSIAIFCSLLGCNPTVAEPPKSTPAKETTANAAAADSQPTADAKSWPKLLTDEELAAGWIALFDGETLFGWKANSEADWKVQDGAIVLTA